MPGWRTSLLDAWVDISGNSRKVAVTISMITPLMRAGFVFLLRFDKPGRQMLIMDV
jgi:hypothetical protein